MSSVRVEESTFYVFVKSTELSLIKCSIMSTSYTSV